MIIGLDLDDTISDLPEFFSVLTRALVDAGHEVHVISFRQPGTEPRVERELADLGIAFTALHIPEDLVQPPSWKADVARELKLDVMIEDSPEVLAAMPAGTRRLWLCDEEVFDLDVCVNALNEDIR